ncbi:MAG: T9SS type A sorting domain-containing protein [Bacteroidales bacterium]|nr:T9SS type A sorting domain-containing protein [Bacteroidales bacterium]
MKKTLFILVVLFCATIVKGQNVSDTIFDDYFLPDYIDVEGCAQVMFSDINEDPMYEGMVRNHYYFSYQGGPFRYNGQEYSGVLDRAQPCYTDTLLTIKGIAIGVHNYIYEWVESYYTKLTFILRGIGMTGYNYCIDAQRYNDALNSYNSNPKGKLKIMNDRLDVEIASIDIDTNFSYNNVNANGGVETYGSGYIEYYLNNPVNVNGLFYIVEDVTPTSTMIALMVASDCSFDYPSLVRTAELDDESPWVQWCDHLFNTYPIPGARDTNSTYHYNPVRTGGYHHVRNTCQMYMFPIFAETDSTLGDGVNFGENDTTDMCIYDATVDRYSNVSPNPASDVLTVQSSFKIREIEIHNSLGQVVLRKEGKQNIETLDVSMLESGMYIVKIKTQRGFANKKLIIQ